MRVSEASEVAMENALGFVLLIEVSIKSFSHLGWVVALVFLLGVMVVVS